MEDIEIDGVLHDLSHLKRFIVTLEGKGKEGADLRVAVDIGLHTISRACQEGEDSNMVDENGKARVFCEDRYAFSLGLPELAKRMIEQKYFCWESRDRNQAVNYAIIDIAPGRVLHLEDGDHQVIFFYLYPADEEHADVILFVISCHMREMKFSKSQRRYDTHMLLRKCHFSGKRMP
jgi:hypothetical protein